MSYLEYQVDPKITLAVLVNPKTRELVEVRRIEGIGVLLKYPGLPYDEEDILGAAHYDEAEVFEDNNGYEYVRSHSPVGVTVQGKGFGVVLYSGLCLKAFADIEDASIEGIASTSGASETKHSSRTKSSEKFWESAVRNGLAHEGTAEGVENRRFELDREYFEGSGCEIVGDDACLNLVDISGSIDIEYRAKTNSALAQFMKAEEILGSGLVFALPGVKENLDYVSPSAEILATLNLEHCYDVGLAEQLILLAIREDFEEDVVDQLLRRLPDEVYRRTSFYNQLRPKMVANAAQKAFDKEVKKVWGAEYGSLLNID